VATFGKKKLDFLRRFLAYDYGTPSHDQLGLLFGALNAKQFQQCFINWVTSLTQTLRGVVAVDGKTLRRAFDKKGIQGYVHMVSAWSSEQRLVLGPTKVVVQPPLAILKRATHGHPKTGHLQQQTFFIYIPLRLENPKICGIDDAEVVSDGIAIDTPIFGYFVT
jgi:hypothetical protein